MMEKPSAWRYLRIILELMEKTNFPILFLQMESWGAEGIQVEVGLQHQWKIIIELD